MINKKGVGINVLISGAIAIVVLAIIIMVIVQFNLLGNLKYVFLSPDNLNEQTSELDTRYYPECIEPVAVIHDNYLCFCSEEFCSKCVPSRVYLRNNILSVSTGQIQNLDIGILSSSIIYIDDSLLDPTSSKWKSISNYFWNFEGLVNLNESVFVSDKFFCREEVVNIPVPETHKEIEIGYIAQSKIFLKDGTDTRLYFDGNSIYFKNERFFGFARDILVGSIIKKASIDSPYYYGDVVIANYLLDESTLPEELKGQQVAATLKIIDGSIIVGNKIYMLDKSGIQEQNN